MTAADFHHPLLGAVTRFDPTFTVRPLVDISLQSTEGEWGGLQYAASLIAKRFPSKVRGYLHHMPKAMTKATTQEATVMWEEEMNEAATRGFRASARGVADIEMSWLTSWLQIERWREAMLWSFIVGRVGGADGVWGPDSRDAMRSVLGNVDSRGMVLIKGGKRSTLQAVANTMPLADQPKGTRYGFCEYCLASYPIITDLATQHQWTAMFLLDRINQTSAPTVYFRSIAACPPASSPIHPSHTVRRPCSSE
jgi:3-O-alpha-D-mannopyranosyl-alpha-D-mannopyranose xylosylphosphotransferase